MKKTYISPELLIMQLGTIHMMAESLPVGGGSGETIDNPDDILTKEDKSSVWDKEW